MHGCALRQALQSSHVIFCLHFPWCAFHPRCSFLYYGFLCRTCGADWMGPRTSHLVVCPYLCPFQLNITSRQTNLQLPEKQNGACSQSSTSTLLNSCVPIPYPLLLLTLHNSMPNPSFFTVTNSANVFFYIRKIKSILITSNKVQISYFSIL